MSKKFKEFNGFFSDPLWMRIFIPGHLAHIFILLMFIGVLGLENPRIKYGVNLPYAILFVLLLLVSYLLCVIYSSISILYSYLQWRYEKPKPVKEKKERKEWKYAPLLWLLLFLVLVISEIVQNLN
jgi:uncharacterized membrane protein